MIIIDKARFALGVFDIIVGIALVVVCIVQGRPAKAAIAFMCIILGAISIINAVKTKRQQQKRIDEIKSKAKLLGWNEEDSK